MEGALVFDTFHWVFRNFPVQIEFVKLQLLG